MKKIIYILFILFSTGAIAQQTLTGTINDSKNTPLAGVSVFIADLQTGAISDDKGSFTISNLPKSTVAIQFTLVGYKSQVKNVNTETSTTITVSIEASAT